MKVEKGTFVKVPIHEITQAKPGIFIHHVNAWWAMTEEGEVLLYEGKYPQCHRSKDHMLYTLRPENRRLIPDAVGIVFLPMAYVHVDLADYCD